MEEKEEIKGKAIKALIPDKWQEEFTITEIKETDHWEIILTEKKKNIPKEIAEKEVVKNGYMPSIDLEDFPLRGKPTILRFYRRRWKIRGQSESHYNQYDFHKPGMKATPEFGAFLKELNREETDWVRDNWQVH